MHDTPDQVHWYEPEAGEYRPRNVSAKADVRDTFVQSESLSTHCGIGVRPVTVERGLHPEPGTSPDNLTCGTSCCPWRIASHSSLHSEHRHRIAPQPGGNQVEALRFHLRVRRRKPELARGMRDVTIASARERHGLHGPKQLPDVR
jgi:hypothetical protein